MRGSQSITRRHKEPTSLTGLACSLLPTSSTYHTPSSGFCFVLFCFDVVAMKVTLVAQYSCRKT